MRKIFSATHILREINFIDLAISDFLNFDFGDFSQFFIAKIQPNQNSEAENVAKSPFWTSYIGWNGWNWFYEKFYWVKNFQTSTLCLEKLDLFNFRKIGPLY